ncbi:MAG: glycosyltransferase family 2 protein, partial [Lacunisphaera sp.]
PHSVNFPLLSPGDKHTDVMRLVAVSVVKNEADIIEAFVRHTLAWVDHHLIFDHDSTDGTREILGALRAEGLPIRLFTDEAIENLQDVRSHYLSQLAIRDHDADWVLPLDADEFLTGYNRTTLEETLKSVPPGEPASVRHLNYYTTHEDDPTITNPALRLRYCQTSLSVTKKLLIPKQLLLDAEVSVGKGSHVLFRRNTPVTDRPLPEQFYLCHLALRSPQHQVLRVVLAELQKLSRGKLHEGLDVHYRLGFQLLAEDPSLFFSTVCPPVASLSLKSIDYRGGALTAKISSSGWTRFTRALVPYLEKLAVSHGKLVDQATAPSPQASTAPSAIHELSAEEIQPINRGETESSFAGFVAQSGWGPAEGPVPEAFLPPFHWAYGPATELLVHSSGASHAILAANALTYSDGQTVQIELNGQLVLEHPFSRINQKERLVASLTLREGDNNLVMRYSKALVADHDSRQLAVIFLSLQIIPDAIRQDA